VQFIWNGIQDAFDLLIHGDAQTYGILGVTIHVAVVSTLIALAIGLPIGLWLGLGRFRGRRVLLAIANAGMGLPPVVVGLVLALLLFRGAPLGGLHWIYSLPGVICAQAILALPIVIALTAAAVLSLPEGLLAQARALHANWIQVAVLAAREARVGLLAATIAALGAALSEVGAVVLVGGNIEGQTQTLASALLVRVSAGEYGRAIALGAILLGLIAVLSAGLTVAQQRTVDQRR
jgi:tungstate transport system permease protein